MFLRHIRKNPKSVYMWSLQKHLIIISVDSDWGLCLNLYLKLFICIYGIFLKFPWPYIFSQPTSWNRNVSCNHLMCENSSKEVLIRYPHSYHSKLVNKSVVHEVVTFVNARVYVVYVWHNSFVSFLKWFSENLLGCVSNSSSVWNMILRIFRHKKPIEASVIRPRSKENKVR